MVRCSHCCLSLFSGENFLTPPCGHAVHAACARLAGEALPCPVCGTTCARSDMWETFALGERSDEADSAGGVREGAERDDRARWYLCGRLTARAAALSEAAVVSRAEAARSCAELPQLAAVAAETRARIASKASDAKRAIQRKHDASAAADAPNGSAWRRLARPLRDPCSGRVAVGAEALPAAAERRRDRRRRARCRRRTGWRAVLRAAAGQARRVALRPAGGDEGRVCGAGQGARRDVPEI